MPMFNAISNSTEERIQQAAHPLNNQEDLDPLLDYIGDARFVLLGEATHGTSEYYLWRMRISQRLIREKGFSFIAVEGDWPDCYRVNRYIKGYQGAGNSAYDVLNTYERWPTWMWANWEVVALVEWLRRYNAQQPDEKKVGFYGLDVYSLWESLTEVTSYLEQNAPAAVQAAYRAYSCFQPYNEDAQSYAYATHLVPTSCESEVINLLMETQRKASAVRYDGDAEAGFNAEQNAYVTVGAERYYRTMIRGDAESWNIRDHHMVDTLGRLVKHYGDSTKAIIWEHNTHIGDARATPMAGAGMVNVGQLTRDRFSEDGVVLIGFGAYQGSVIAGRSWGAQMEVMPVPEAPAVSWEGILHQGLTADSLLLLTASEAHQRLFQDVRGHRAIGVVYNPNERRGASFVPTSLSQRYDAFIYFEQAEALHPLHLEPVSTEPPETYPWGV
jgi:erythromycin esterase